MAETLAENGLKLCETPSERKVWLYTFSNPFVHAKTPPIVYFVGGVFILSRLFKFIHKNIRHLWIYLLLID